MEAAIGLLFTIAYDAIKGDGLNANKARITRFMAAVDKGSKEQETSPRKFIQLIKEHFLEEAVSVDKAYEGLSHRHFRKRHRYKKRKEEIGECLRWIENDVELNECLDKIELVAKMSEMNTRLDKLMRQPTD